MEWTPAPDMDPLDDNEWETLRTLLRRYCAANLDQFELWRTETRHGTVYITLNRKPLDDSTRRNYNLIDPASGDGAPSHSKLYTNNGRI